jgi:hypothetical protein
MLTKDIKASLPTMPGNVSDLQTMALELHEKMEKLKVLEEMARNYELENRLLRERVHQLVSWFSVKWKIRSPFLVCFLAL